MTLIATSHSSESGHWYSRDGDPRYTIIGKNGKLRNTTLRDAREHDLVPSVTTILNIAAKPALTNWLQEQVLLAALTLPREENEPESVYIKRIMEDSKTQGRDAADLGTDIHAAIQSFYEGRKESRFPFHVAACDKALQHTFGEVDWICERSFAHEMGFGGKCDLYSAVGDGLVVDIKTKDFDDESISKVKPYDEHMMQLAAYRVGLGVPKARCANVFSSRTNPELVIVHQWAEEDIQRGWLMFCALLNFWQLKNNMNNIKAFPTAHPSEKYQFVDSDMDLRDYFAAKAMEGILMNCASDDLAGEELFIKDDQSLIESALTVYATAAYRMADAMMKARGK